MIINSKVPFTGKIAGIRVWQSGDKLIGAAINKDAVDPKTDAQLRQRIKMNNILDVYANIKVALKENFEGILGNRNAAGFFRSYNLHKRPVWLTWYQKQMSCSLLAPYVVAQGKLETVEYSFSENIFTTGINIGALVIDENTVIGDLADAICRNNEGWSHGDTLQLMLLQQQITPSPDFTIVEKRNNDTAGELKSIKSAVFQVTINRDYNKLLCQQPMFETLHPLTEGMDVINYNGMLAVRVKDTQDFIYAFACVHGRGEGTKRLCSTQELLLSDTQMYDRYTTDAAFTRAKIDYEPKRRR